MEACVHVSTAVCLCVARSPPHLTVTVAYGRVCVGVGVGVRVLK